MPKLRASCDACGVAKVKCDRGSPTCGRCKLQGSSCVYGVCRRTGKPPGSSMNKQRSSSIMEDDWGMEDGTRTPLSPMFATPLPHSMPLLSTSSESSRSGSINALHDQDLFASFLHQPHPPMDLNDFACNIDSGSLKPFSAAELANLTSFTSFTDDMHHTQYSSHVDATDLFPPVLEPMELSGTNDKHHECVKEAYKILGEVAFIPTASKSGSSAPASPGNLQQRPLDQILHVNRKAGDRLHRLLTCSCAKSSGLAMVHASAIWRVLQTYQQAADSVSFSAKGTRHHDAPGCRSSPVSMSPTHSAHDSMFGGMQYAGKATANQRSQIAPANISVGSFVIGDDRVNISLSLQLLSDETRRIGNLAHLLASGSSPYSMQSPALGAADDMEEMLPKWLMREYDKAASFIQARFMSLSA